MTEKQLVEYGFHQIYEHPIYENADAYYQKCYRGMDGSKKYFIEAKHYTIIHPTTGDNLGGWEYSTQVYAKGTHDAIDMKWLDEDSFEDFIGIIEDMFASGLLEPYEA